MVNYQSVFTGRPLIDMGLRSTFMNEPDVVMTSCEVSEGESFCFIIKQIYIYMFEAN